MKKIFLDTNFLLDLLVRGENFHTDAKSLLMEGLKRNFKFYISFLSVANFAYICRKDERAKLSENIRLICSLFTVVSNSEDHLIGAMEFKDYEDGIQYATAVSAGCDCIITRNQKDFRDLDVPVYSPLEFLSIEVV